MTSAELRVAFNTLPKVSQAAVDWLAPARPSQAFLLCICSGPWIYARRHQVQQQALAVLGTRDLTTAEASEFSFPLSWQTTYYRKAASVSPDIFDSIFVRCCMTKHASSGVRDEALRVFNAIFGDTFHVPKVIGLFVRDYLGGPCFPVDRHVRAWLDRNGIASISQALHLCEDAEIDPGVLSRAIFASVSKNPTDLQLPA